MAEDRKQSTSQMSSALRTFTVLEEVARQQPVSLSELAHIFDYSKSTIQRTLTTLEGAGWIMRSSADASLWEISPRALLVRPRSLNGGELLTRSQEPMTWLKDAVNETIHLSVVDRLESMVLVFRVDCEQAVRTFSPIGDISPLHATATGKSVLAYLSQEQLDIVLRRQHERFTPFTVTDRDQLLQQLSEVRRLGYSINDREYRSAVSAIGAPIFDARGLPVASICISMPHTRFNRQVGREFGKLVREAADRISVSA
jgi:IclR family acetate operon transcriptional repressor